MPLLYTWLHRMTFLVSLNWHLSSFHQLAKKPTHHHPILTTSLKKRNMLVSSSCILHPFCWGPLVFIWMSIYRVVPHTLSDQSDHLYAYECTAATEHAHHYLHKKTCDVTGSGWQAASRVIRQSLWQPRHWLVIAVVCQVSGAASKSTAFGTAEYTREWIAN